MKFLYFVLFFIWFAGCSDPAVNLHHAALEGDLATVKRLVASGSDINGRDGLGSTPLHYATNKYHTEVMKFLLESGADVNAQQNEGTTALVHAVVASGSSVAEILLKYGADPNIQGSNGLTALDTAEMMNRTAAIKVLQAHGAKRGELKIGIIESGSRFKRPVGAKYKMVFYSSQRGSEIQELTQYGIEVTHIPLGGTTLVLSPSSRISPSLQRLPPGARVDIVELDTGKVIFSHKY